MTDPDNIPIFNMPPPQSASSKSNINNVRPQLPTPNERLEPSSSLDPSHSFKRPRISSDNNHSNALMAPPSRMNHPPPNTQKNNIFFKTRHCFKFGSGSCTKGASCSYAHGKEELRQPPPNWQELKQLQLGGNRNDYSLLHKDTAKFMNDSQKTRESSAITVSTVGNNLEGTEERLQLGGNRDDNSFLHDYTAKCRNDSGETRESSAITIQTIGNKSETQLPSGTYRKTEICHKWKYTGSCTLGDHCSYSHGDADLRVPGRGKKYKTEAAVAIENSTKAVIPTTTLRTTGSSAEYAPTLPASVPAMTEEEKKKANKELFLKKPLEKINRIYGDWIDDLPGEP